MNCYYNLFKGSDFQVISRHMKTENFSYFFHGNPFIKKKKPDLKINTDLKIDSPIYSPTGKTFFDFSKCTNDTID